MRTKVFALRTIKEILRDPLSYILSMAFPILMLIIMTIIDASIPAEANMTAFRINNLAPGIAYFGLTFIMLFTCIQISKDRATALVMRLQASPMKPFDFIFGYIIAVISLAIMQMVITYAASVIVALITGVSLPIGGLLLSILTLLPSAIMLISFGLLFGAIVNEKAAPGMCSIIISLAGIIGGVWMDVDSLGGVLLKVCKWFPFYHGVKLARIAISGNNDNLLKTILIVLAWMLGILLLSTFAMDRKLRKDVKM